MDRIIVAHGEINELAKLFNVSLPTVRKALRGSSINTLSFKIRKAAIERGGVIVKIVDKSK